MKKVICILLTLLLLVSLCACNSQTTDNNKSNSENTTHSIETTTEETYIEYPETMRKNGEYPESIQELTDEEINFHNKLIFDAIQTLDISILERYTDEKSADAVEALKNIKSDNTYRALFEKSISDIRYIPSCNYMLAKSTFYTFAKWYENCELIGHCPVNNIQDLTNEQVKEIYDKYYTDAPYVPAPFNAYRVYSRIVDGKIIYDIDGIFSQFGYMHLSYLNPKETEFSKNGYPQLILYNYEQLNFNNILQEGNCPRYKEILTKDLNKMVEIANKISIPDDVFYKKYYEKYYKDDAIRTKIQNWINENTEFIRAPHIVGVFIKPTLNKTFPFYNFTEREINDIKELNLATYSHIGDFEKDFNTWNGYYDVLKAMEDSDAIALSKN